MYGFKILALALGALFCTVAATESESCGSGVTTITVSIPESGTTPAVPTPTVPGSSAPGLPVETTETAGPHPVHTPISETPVHSSPVEASSLVPEVPSSSMTHSSGFPVLHTTVVPSSTATHNVPSTVTSQLPMVSTAGAAATPGFGLGPIFGAAAAAVMVVAV